MEYGNEEPADIIYEWINQRGWVEPCRMTEWREQEIVKWTRELEKNEKNGGKTRKSKENEQFMLVS